jgi:hypothetical protein
VKRICGLLLSGICLILGVLETRAQTLTTNYWVQNVNSTITAYVQSGGSIISGTMPSKQLLTFLSGVTNLNNVLQTITNVTVTNSTVNVTDSPKLPPTNFPAEYDLNTNYVVFGITNNFYSTNNFDFTNDIVFTQTDTNPVTYTFTNVVELTNGEPAYLFPNIQASSLTAVLVTNNNGSNVVFALSGVVTNTTSTDVFEVFPDFSKQKGARLIYVTPIVTTNGVATNSTALPSLFMVRYSVGRTVTNVDVSACFSEGRNTAVATAASPFTQASYSLSEIKMDTTFPTSGFFGTFPQEAGTVLDIIGFDFQQRGIVFSKGKPVPASVLKARKLSGGGDGQVNGQIISKGFNQATAVFNGSISFAFGHLESHL